MRIAVFFLMIFSFAHSALAATEHQGDSLLQPIEPLVGSWSFSGIVMNESGEHYGYFFQMQRQGSNFHVKTALIDEQSKQLRLFYEHRETLDNSFAFNWHVGHSFLRYNPINDSWIFGVKLTKEQGFNFKVDMLKQVNQDNKSLILRPGVELQAIQTSRVNGHMQISADTKEQFVTGTSAWFAKVWFSAKQNAAHDISTTFCRLNNDDGFYSANLKEVDATSAAIAGWRDSLGNKVKMSQFISIKALADNLCLLNIGVPKLSLKLMNTLKSDAQAPLSIAGFSQDSKGFCFVTEQSFSEIQEAAVKAAA